MVALLPELDRRDAQMLVGEPRADCARCVKLPGHAGALKQSCGDASGLVHPIPICPTSERTWRRALQAARPIEPELVARLCRIGALRAPDAP